MFFHRAKVIKNVSNTLTFRDKYRNNVIKHSFETASFSLVIRIKIYNLRLVLKKKSF